MRWGGLGQALPLPPALIDFSPYWRPVEFATAIVVADALVWERADPADVSAAMSTDGFGQFLVRALLFRIIVNAVTDPDSISGRAEAYAPAVDHALRLIVDRQ